jgi:hypothetical protein
MFTVPFNLGWHVLQPVMYRLLGREHVERFFADGTLRLSCFTQFHQHTDEQRLDAQEGGPRIQHEFRRPDGRPELITSRLMFGRNAYVLCGATVDSPDLAEKFGVDSCIAIQNTTGFANSVAQQIPGLVEGAEGPCIYGTMFKRDLGVIAIEPPPTADQLGQFILNQVRHYPYFVKHSTFAHQLEYRLVWLTDHEVTEPLTVKVPAAIQHCQRDTPNRWGLSGRPP